MNDTPGRGTQDVVSVYRADAKEAVTFLRHFDPDGRHNLVAIHPETGEVHGRTFPPGAWSEIEAWVARRNGRENLYFSPNEPTPDAPDGKLRKHHIGAIRAVFADIDPDPSMPVDEARAALRAHAAKALAALPPAITVDSGGGFNFFWPLAEKLDAETYRARVEAQGRGVGHLLGGDAVQNVDRILRLPGTLNIPDAKKRARGRVPAPATVMRLAADRFTLEGLAQAYKPRERTDAETDSDEAAAAVMAELDMAFIRDHDTPEALPADLWARFERARQRNPALDDLWCGRTHPKDTSNSGWRFRLAFLLRNEHAFTPTEFGALCYAWDRVDPDGLTARDLARDWARAPVEVPDPSVWIEELPIEDTTPPTDTFAVVTVDELRKRPPPEWLIDRHIPRQSVGFLYSRPGAGKSFMALDMALHIATGAETWHGDPIRSFDRPRVLYIVAEGVYGFVDRIDAWEQRNGRKVGDGFLMIEHTINFMRAEDVAKLRNTVRAHGGAFDLVVVDTVSRALPGADENLQKDMTLFVAACEAVKRTTGGAVLGIHHAGKQGDMRGSTVLLGAGDFVFRLDRKAGASVGALLCEKQKDAADGWEEAYAFERIGLGFPAGSADGSGADEAAGGDAAGAGRSSLVPVRCFETIGPEATLTPSTTAAVLQAMEQAWREGSPWATAPQTKERFFVRRMASDFGFKAQQAEDMMAMWLSMGVVREEISDRRSKRKGLKVVGELGQDVPNEGIFG